ncbi:MAG: glycosyltransferase family 4 protein [Chloroflexota bacterium]
MRILHLIPRYHPAKGGAENHMAEISTRLVAKGHEVTVVTSDALDVELFWQAGWRRSAETESVIEGVRVRRFPIHHLPAARYSYAAIRRLLWIFAKFSFVPTQLAWRLARFTPWVPELLPWLYKSHDSFDLVAAMGIGYEPWFEAGLLFARRHNIPFVTYPLTHLGAGKQPGTDELGRFYTMRHQNALVLQSDGVIAQTETEKQFYVEQGVKPDQIWPIGPGVNPSDFLAGEGRRGDRLKGDGAAFRMRHQIDADSPLVISVSQMSYDKGTIHTVEAVRLLWENGFDVELALAGAVLEPFSRYLAQLPGKDRARIHLLGLISDDERNDMLAAADMLVMPSRTDSFGIVYLEAWVHGKPVIGADTWGVSDVITNGKDGLLVPFGDVIALANTIGGLADESALANVMGKLGRDKVYAQHTWEHKIDAIEEIYTKLVKAHASCD